MGDKAASCMWTANAGTSMHQIRRPHEGAAFRDVEVFSLEPLLGGDFFKGFRVIWAVRISGSQGLCVVGEEEVVGFLAARVIEQLTGTGLGGGRVEDGESGFTPASKDFRAATELDTLGQAPVEFAGKVGPEELIGGGRVLGASFHARFRSIPREGVHTYKKIMSETLLTRLRSASRLFLRRAFVGSWKRWREPALAGRCQHELAVCAIFREEAPFLDEWLRFHAGVGFTHFYLYNNFSTDEFREVLRPWQESGQVTLTEWPQPAGQISAYSDCLRRFQKNARWIAFFDIDEFLFSPGNMDLRPILTSFSDWPGIEVWQYFFGSNGHLKRPKGLVCELYTRRAPVSRRSTVKTIANPRLVYKPSVHQFKYWIGQARDPSRQVVHKGTMAKFHKLRMNHYWSRSLEDLNTKIARGDASTFTPRDRGWHLAFERDLNAEEDCSILETVRAIR